MAESQIDWLSYAISYYIFAPTGQKLGKQFTTPSPWQQLELDTPKPPKVIP